MQVNCSKCNSPYYLSDRQTAVGYFSCDACGALNPLPSAPTGTRSSLSVTASSKDWHIHRAGGQRLSFQGLAALQGLITSGQTTADDLLSRDGKKWKRLGDIGELEGFFAEAAARQRN